MESGEKFGMLTTIERIKNPCRGDQKWLCVCDCGEKVNVFSGNLKRGNSTNCGCVRRAKCAIRMKTLNHKHGETNTALFGIWAGIIERTTCKGSQNYHRYGGRGITVSDSWRNFENFKRDVGVRPSQNHTIDRIDNNKGYELGNVRWATPYEQARNRRTNRFVLISGVPMILTDAAIKLGISKTTASRWLASGRLDEV